MPIATTCPHCRYAANAPDDTLGGSVKCPRCQRSFVVANLAGNGEADDFPAGAPFQKKTSGATIGLSVTAIIIWSLLGLATCGGLASFLMATSRSISTNHEVAIAVVFLTLLATAYVGVRCVGEVLKAIDRLRGK